MEAPNKIYVNTNQFQYQDLLAFFATDKRGAETDLEYQLVQPLVDDSEISLENIVPEMSIEDLRLEMSKNPLTYREADDWIDVKTQLPTSNSKWSESEYVLCYRELHREQVVCWYNVNEGTWHVANYKADSLPINDVTHWKPLPPPPNKK
jgi:hypothetical protein